MRIHCKHCGATAVVSHSQKIMPGMNEVYANCSNHKCQCRFVVNISHKRDLIPPINKMGDQGGQLLLEGILNSLPRDQRLKLGQKLMAN